MTFNTLLLLCRITLVHKFLEILLICLRWAFYFIFMHVYLVIYCDILIWSFLYLELCHLVIVWLLFYAFIFIHLKIGCLVIFLRTRWDRSCKFILFYYWRWRICFFGCLLLNCRYWLLLDIWWLLHIWWLKKLLLVFLIWIFEIPFRFLPPIQKLILKRRLRF